MGLRECAEVGSMVATYCLETQGGQEYRFSREHFIERFTESYGNESAKQLTAFIPNF
jgi:adenosine kinase